MIADVLWTVIATYAAVVVWFVGLVFRYARTVEEWAQPGPADGQPQTVAPPAVETTAFTETELW